ncbi:MAG: hypothetical protein LAQ69_03415 [Acidobacteriia bacterium]|nr:hypothetical protein [Terriglobia bacterium]
MNEKCIETVPNATSNPESGEAHVTPNELVGCELALCCRSCGNRWSVLPGPDGEFFPGFWLCLRGCDG